MDQPAVVVAAVTGLFTLVVTALTVVMTVILAQHRARVIAHELVASIRGSVSVDWVHREAARARIRVLVKRILRKYGYPPDLQDAAVQTVLQQAEALSAAWAA